MVTRVLNPDHYITRLLTGGDVAVAVSGGPDSMALLHMLLSCGVTCHALTLDHGLRAESADEARQVGGWLSGWDNVTHHIIKWRGTKPQTGIMEAARDARYDHLCRWCRDHDIGQLFVAHHAGDQVETFLFRLAHGSGLDGLGGMADVTPHAPTGIDLVRPLLGVGKDQILKYCERHAIPFVNDPSNRNTDYARPRLRAMMPALAEEGLTEDRLARTVERLRRARQALDYFTTRFIAAEATIGPQRSTINLPAMIDAPADLRVRAVRQLVQDMGARSYGPRLDRLEDLLDAMFADPAQAKPFTLGGFIFALDRRRKAFVITREKT